MEILKALAPYKLYIYAALGALAVAGWMFDRHTQYVKGKNDCLLNQAKAQASYWENRSERLSEEGKEALKEEQKTSSVIERLKQYKETKLNESTNTACTFTGDGVRDINDSIRKANNP